MERQGFAPGEDLLPGTMIRATFRVECHLNKREIEHGLTSDTRRTLRVWAETHWPAARVEVSVEAAFSNAAVFEIEVTP